MQNEVITEDDVVCPHCAYIAGYWEDLNPNMQLGVAEEWRCSSCGKWYTVMLSVRYALTTKTMEDE